MGRKAGEWEIALFRQPAGKRLLAGASCGLRRSVQHEFDLKVFQLNTLLHEGSTKAQI